MAEPNGITLPPTKPQYQFNGVNSQNSSRGASPVPKPGNIPQSQLPPQRTHIPSSQLPPMRGLTQKVGQLSVSGQNTPNISPNRFSTSTPNTGVRQEKPVFSGSSSPVVPVNVPSMSDANRNIFANQNQPVNGGMNFVNSVPQTPYVAPRPQLQPQLARQQPPLTNSQPLQPHPSLRPQPAPSYIPAYSERPQAPPQASILPQPPPSAFQTHPQPSRPNYPQYPPSSQRFNPQINYNVGPPPSRLPQPTVQEVFEPNQGVVQTGFNRLWGAEHHDLLQQPNILPPGKITPPAVNLGQEHLNQANCSAEVFRSTITKIPETASLLQKSRLPLGLLIHPFKDLSYLPVIQCNVIVRCRSCRTYINPFVFFVDSKRWKCNLCFRVNELPEEFQYDPVSKTYGDPSRRPEIKTSTIEYIAPAEYMLRPPQPAVYLFLLDVSRFAVESGYLQVLCTVLAEEIKNLPGDARTQIGFLAYDSALHFFSLAEGLNQPHRMTVLDIEDIFLPTPDNLLVNLKDRMDMVLDLLKLLPEKFEGTFDGNSALGAALQAAHKMMSATGGRVSVFQASLPNTGPGACTPREDPSQRSSAETVLLNPVNDFYKRLALECSGQQIAVDLFVVNSQYCDIATISGISRFSGGSIHHFPLFKSNKPLSVDGFVRDLKRYLTRKIGFEAVMRVRCTRGLAIKTFHGNFFVRSTDLLSLPNINPDSAFGMQVAIEENLNENQTVCFQAALLYTSSKGERRIRVHTLCLPIVNTLQDVINSADQQCIVGLLGKMAVDRSMQASLSDAREAFINAVVDVLSAYKFSLNMGNAVSGLLAPECLKLLPLYIAAVLKHPAFRIGSNTRLDDRVKSMIDMKTLPLPLLMQQIYPDLYPIHNLDQQPVVLNNEEEPTPQPPKLHLSARCLENKGAFLMDCGHHMMILVGPNVNLDFLNNALGVADYNSIEEFPSELPVLNNDTNQRLHLFINYLNDEKPFNATLHVVRENSPSRGLFMERLIEDRLENSLSYHEFLQHLKTQIK